MNPIDDRKPASGLANAWILVIALSNVALHLAFYNTLGFFRDELLYFSLGSHPAAGYASVPPFTGITAWLMIQVFGSNLFAARLLPALFSGVMVLLASGIARELKGGSYARILAAIGFLVMPMNLRGFSMFQPVFLDFFFWTLIFWIVLKWMNTQKDLYLYLLGVVSGLALLNKYLVPVQLVCLGVAILFTPHRAVFRNKALYISLLIGIIVFLPNLWWQFSHHFPVLVHMRALHDSQLVHVNRVNFLTDQLFLAFLSFGLIIPGLVGVFTRRSLKPYRWLAVASLLVIVVLWALRGKSYYTAGVYPFLVCLGAVMWEKYSHRIWVRVVVPVLMILLTLPVLPAAIPIWKAPKLAEYFAGMRQTVGFEGLLRDERGNIQKLPQDYADMLGWDELAAATARAWDSIPDHRAAFIYCENYGQAGAITILGKKYGLPQPVSFCESYYYWAPRDFPEEITSLVYINDELGADIRELFSEVQAVGGITDPLAREYGTTVYLCRKPTSSFNVFWRERIKEVKSPF